MTAPAHDRKWPPLQRASVGVGFKPAHAADALAGDHGVSFFEVRAEHYMGEGGPPHRLLADLRTSYALSLNGVGLSLGGADPLDRDHLHRLKHLIDRYEPALFSEHLSWSVHEGVYFNDLLPLPYNEATLSRVGDRIDAVQEMLGRTILIENPATYVAFTASTISEGEFLRELVHCTGCGLLLDVNAAYVSAVNHGGEPMVYLDDFPLEHVAQIHLAGFAEDHDDRDARLLIDAHSAPVADIVWLLYRRTLARIGPVPTLLEWDNDVPSFSVVAGEAARARKEMDAEIARRARRRREFPPRPYEECHAGQC